MPKFKNIRIKMKGGKSRLQRVQVLASGKYKFVKNLVRGRSASFKSPKPTKKRSGGLRSMARKKKSYSRGSLIRTGMKILRGGSLFAPAAARALGPGSAQDKLNLVLNDYTGFYPPAGDFQLSRMKTGWLPFIGTSLATYAIPKIVNLIRRL